MEITLKEIFVFHEQSLSCYRQKIEGLEEQVHALESELIVEQKYARKLSDFKIKSELLFKDLVEVKSMKEFRKVFKKHKLLVAPSSTIRLGMVDEMLS